jgi:hypothetical protein
VAGLGEAFKPGLEGFGNVEKAIAQFLNSGGRGIQAIESLKNAAFEFKEAGGNFENFKDRLVAAGLTADEARQVIEQFANRGVTSLDEIINASDELLGAVTGDLQNLGFGFKEVADEVLTVEQAFGRLDEFKFKAKEIRVNVSLNDPNNVLEEAPVPTAPEKTQAFAQGGIITGRTTFRHSGGIGIAGERGPEAIFPLSRRGGRLGIEVPTNKQTGPVNITVNAQNADPGVEGRIFELLMSMEDRIMSGAIAAVASAGERGRF